MKKILCLIITAILVFSTASLAFAADVQLSAGGFDIAIDANAREIGDGVILLNDYGMSMTYLIVGSESCLLIDTGTGFEGFRQRVEQYTDGKPLTVALTHGHVDHAGGSQQFEKVYVNDADKDVLWQRSILFRKFFFGYTLAAFKHVLRLPNISNKDNVENSETVSMEDGHVFDLGDRKVTFYLTPGHTPGSGCFYDDKTGYLFTGDITAQCVLMIFLESTDLTTYNESLKKIAQLEQKATKIYAGHSLSPIDPAYTQLYLEMTQELLQKKFSPPLPFVKTGEKVLADGTTIYGMLIGWLNKK